MSSGKTMIISLIVGLIKKIQYKYALYKMSQCFPNAYVCSNELNLSNYMIKIDLKQAGSVNTPNLAAKLDIASSKAEVDKIHIGK